MKIVHVVDSMEIGGAETLVSQMCLLQRKQGHNPCVYAVLTLGPLGEQMRAEGFDVQANVGRHFSDAGRNFFRIFKESHPDVVHLHNPTPTVYAAMAARMADVPSIISTRHSLVAPPRRLITELKYAMAATCCDWIVGICDATTANLKGMHSVPAHKIVRVYNGTDSVSRVAKEQRPPKSGFTLIYVGRLEPVKNHALLLNAFCVALQSMPGLRLWMVGDGGERKMLESLAAELSITSQVTFWGQQLDVAPLFSAADAFIMSSKSEGLPVSLLQAFSMGLPAIVTDVGGMAEVVRLARAGLTVSLTDPTEMAVAILRLAARDAERTQFSTNAKAAFHTRFTLPAMVDSYMDLYRNTSRVRRAAKS
ncbi:MAG: glycosyltransferase [Terracidiphilus sp.]|jgi:glycosyltransferase involved in cell wall biosynthesis